MENPLWGSILTFHFVDVKADINGIDDFITYIERMWLGGQFAPVEHVFRG